jgi:hypothetical protein
MSHNWVGRFESSMRVKIVINALETAPISYRLLTLLPFFTYTLSTFPISLVDLGSNLGSQGRAHLGLGVFTTI